MTSVAVQAMITARGGDGLESICPNTRLGTRRWAAENLFLSIIHLESSSQAELATRLHYSIASYRKRFAPLHTKDGPTIHVVVAEWTAT